MGVLAIVAGLPVLFTRKEVQLGCGAIHETRARGAEGHTPRLRMCVRTRGSVRFEYPQSFLRCICVRHRRIVFNTMCTDTGT